MESKSTPKKILIAGPCSIEDGMMAMTLAFELSRLAEKYNFEYIFKASFDKANRTSIDSYRGLGMEQGLEILKNIREAVDCKVITDIHEPWQAEPVARVVDILQIPAFLCRQTDLLLAAGRTGLPVNIKKGQFLSPEAMKFAIDKVKSTGNKMAWACERGVTFGYSDLIVDATSVTRLKKIGAKVIMDCTHSVQKPNKTEGITGGDPSLIESIALSAIATGADGLFLEVHPNPSTAASDPHTMLELHKLKDILEKCINIRNALK